MKQTPLKRKTELRRSKPLNRGRAVLGRGSDDQPAPRLPKRTRRGISPASKVQRDYVKQNPVCVGCGVEASEWVAIDPAHWWPRGKGGCDDVLCLIGGLCRRFDGSGCHRLFDEGQLDLWKLVVTDWPRMKPQFDHATTHANPVEVIERAAGTRIVWADLEEAA